MNVRHARGPLRIWILLGLVSLAVAGASAAEPLRVVIKEAPPFVVKDAAGGWSGPAVELWNYAAAALGRDSAFRELTLKEMLDAVESGEADIAVGALSVTTARERRFDFTHPYHTTGFGIATRQVQGGIVLAILSRLISAPFLTTAGTLLLILLATGALVVFFERRRNPEQFGGGWLKSLGSGFWWSAVTMTTVGYGDKSPQTFGGRAVALVWMFAAVIIISGFTAGIASSLTVERLTAVDGPDDLVKARVGTVRSSSSEEYLLGERIASQGYADLPGALKALAKGELDAVVYDLPLLVWRLESNPNWRGISVLPGSLTSQHYAFAVPTGSELREALNRLIPEYIATDAWREKIKGY